ncbi:FMRFamide receptor [Centruroides vittatus]|uniref:FMRFamide receptor n=1 Tax=Centruroides vittatus TaxID=120091 RepID=UPI0035101BE8
MEDESMEFALGVAIIVVVILGCIGNIMSLFVLSRPELRSSINCGLQGLAVFDTLLIATSLFIFGFPGLGQKIKSFQHHYGYIYLKMVPVLYPLAHIAKTGSIWTTVIVTVERYVAVCHPLKARSICTCSRARFCNFFILLFSIGYNVPRFFEVEVKSFNDTNNETCLACPTQFRTNETYYRVYYVGLNILFT